jgi:hypothetical protein
MIDACAATEVEWRITTTPELYDEVRWDEVY